MKPRAAVIGCGNIGSRWDEASSGNAILTHAGAWHRLGLLTALVDPNPERLVAAGRYWGGSTLYPDYQTLFAAEQLDLVSIATPTALRLPVIEAALAAGVRAILLEKPVATTIEEAQAIATVTRTAGAAVAVNYLRRYDAALRQGAAWVQSGRLGAIQHVVGRYGKGILENGSHWIDLIQWWLGPVQGSRVLRRLSDDRPDHDPTLDAVLEVGPAGAIVPVHLLAVDHRHYALFELDIVGSAGRITLTERGAYLRHWEVITDPLFPGYRVLQLANELRADLEHALLRAAEDLLAAWRGERSVPSCTLEDGLAALKAALALRDTRPDPE
ncbi:Predicted dehydrogenase [Gammaproteobacteria bacterium]